MAARQCIIVGCGSHASAVISIVESSSENYEIVGLADSKNTYDSSESKSGYQVIASVHELVSFPEKYSHLYCVLAIGDNHNRKRVYATLLGKGYSFPNIVSGSAYIDRTVNIGEGNVIGHNTVINASADIGINNLINTGAIVEHHCSIQDHTHIAPRALLCGNVSVSDLAFIGAGAILTPKISIAVGIVVGAGTLVIDSASEKHSTYIGVPAKVLKR